jgi:ribosomal protein L7/L12
MDAPHPVTLPESIRPEVDSLLREGNGNRVPAIKFVRKQTGLSLVDASVIVRRRAEEIL